MVTNRKKGEATLTADYYALLTLFSLNCAISFFFFLVFVVLTFSISALFVAPFRFHPLMLHYHGFFKHISFIL